MKVLSEFGKKGLENIKIKGKPVNLIMDDFFARFPVEYRKNYDNNLKDLEIWKVDKFYDDSFSTGEYFCENNKIIYIDNNSLIHELFHMASYDAKKNALGFRHDNSSNIFEWALLEGATEYFASMALEKYFGSYLFSAYTYSMLSYIDNIYASFFIPSYDNFRSLFPNRLDIDSLTYSLNYFESNVGMSDKDNYPNLRESYRDVIKELINIRMSFDMPDDKNKVYFANLLNHLNNDKIYDMMATFYDKYFDYADAKIKKRSLKR